MFHQMLSVLGAALILLAYVGNQRDVIGPTDRAYNLMNLFGALFLLWVAIVDFRWGFIVLETAWALASLPPLFRPRPVAGGVEPMHPPGEEAGRAGEED